MINHQLLIKPIINDNKLISAYIRLTTKKAYIVTFNSFLTIHQLYNRVASLLRVKPEQILIVTKGKILFLINNINQQKQTSKYIYSYRQQFNKVIKVEQKQIFHIIFYQNIYQFPLMTIYVKILIKFKSIGQLVTGNINNRETNKILIHVMRLQGISRQISNKQLIHKYINSVKLCIESQLFYNLTSTKHNNQQTDIIIQTTNKLQHKIRQITFGQIRQMMRQQVVIINTGRQLSLNKTLIQEYVENGSQLVVTFRTALSIEQLIDKNKINQNVGFQQNSQNVKYKRQNEEQTREIDQLIKNIQSQQVKIKNNNSQQLHSIQIPPVKQLNQQFNTINQQQPCINSQQRLLQRQNTKKSKQSLLLDQCNNTNISLVQNNLQQQNVFQCGLFQSVKNSFQQSQHLQLQPVILQSPIDNLHQISNDTIKYQKELNNCNNNQVTYINDDISINYMPPEVINTLKQLQYQQYFHTQNSKQNINFNLQEYVCYGQYCSKQQRQTIIEQNEQNQSFQSKELTESIKQNYQQTLFYQLNLQKQNLQSKDQQISNFQACIQNDSFQIKQIKQQQLPIRFIDGRTGQLINPQVIINFYLPKNYQNQQLHSKFQHEQINIQHQKYQSNPSSYQLIPQPINKPDKKLKDTLTTFGHQNIMMSSIQLKQNSQHSQQIANRKINIYLQSYNGNLLDITPFQQTKYQWNLSDKHVKEQNLKRQKKQIQNEKGQNHHLFDSSNQYVQINSQLTQSLVTQHDENSISRLEQQNQQISSGQVILAKEDMLNIVKLDMDSKTKTC